MNMFEIIHSLLQQFGPEEWTRYKGKHFQMCIRDRLKEIEKQIKKRAWGEVIRLDVEAEMDKRLLKELKKQLNVRCV